MNMLINIKIGLVGKSLEIKSMLQQEGIPFIEYDFLEYEKHGRHSAMLIVKRI